MQDEENGEDDEYHESRYGVHNRDREKILQTSNRAHKMQLQCITLLVFKYAENLA